MGNGAVRKRKHVDFWALASVLVLILFGIIMIFSASAPTAYINYSGDTAYFAKRQAIWAVVSIFVMIYMMNFDYRKLGLLSPYLMFISIILLILVRVIGVNEKGSYRWIRILGFGFQPSEIAKISIIIFISYSISRRKANAEKEGKDIFENFFKGLFPYLLMMGLFAALLLIEPHLSATVITLTVCSIILFCAGAKIKHFAILIGPVAFLFVSLVTFVPYMRKRVFSFLDPFKDPLGAGYQVIQSLYAIGSGGIFGKGLGKSVQKFMYIPEAHNDFIFAILAEELGFVGIFIVMLLFFILLFRGIKISMTADDLFGSLTAIGITSLIIIQAIFNIAVVSSSAPPTGISLPFLSYGGTSLLIIMTSIGILLNISRYANYERI